MKDWVKIIWASLVLLVLLFLAKMMSPSNQESDVLFKGLIPLAGKYAVKTSILGKDLQGQINLQHTSKTSGVFDFQMTSPILFTCPATNQFTANVADQTVQYSLDQCTVDRLNQNDLTLKSLAYVTDQKALKIDFMWKKVIPVSLLMTYQN